MAVTGETRGIVEGLDDSSDRLHAAFAAHPDAVGNPGGSDTPDRAVSLRFGDVDGPGTEP